MKTNERKREKKRIEVVRAASALVLQFNVLTYISNLNDNCD